MKKSLLCLAVLLACGASAFAAPHVAFPDLPEAVICGDRGGSSISIALSTSGWTASIARGVSSRLDVTMTTSRRSLVELSGRILVVRDLLPLNVLVDLGPERISLVSTLFLGPVHVSFGRSWADVGTRWGYVQYAFDQAATILLGVEERSGVLGPIFGLRLHPGSSRLWAVSLVVTRTDVRVAIGGTL